MKHVLILVLLAMMLVGCGTPKQTTAPPPTPTPIPTPSYTPVLTTITLSQVWPRTTVSAKSCATADATNPCGWIVGSGQVVLKATAFDQKGNPMLMNFLWSIPGSQFDIIVTQQGTVNNESLGGTEATFGMYPTGPCGPNGCPSPLTSSIYEIEVEGCPAVSVQWASPAYLGWSCPDPVTPEVKVTTWVGLEGTN